MAFVVLEKGRVFSVHTHVLGKSSSIFSLWCSYHLENEITECFHFIRVEMNVS